MKKILLLLLSIFFISSPCFAWVTDIAKSDSINKITDVSMTNENLNNASLVENVKILWEGISSILKTALNWILVIFLVYVWVSMIISMWTNEEQLSSSKRQFYYALTGLLFINIPDILLSAITPNPTSASIDPDGFNRNEFTILWNEIFSNVIAGNIISFLEVVIFWSAILMFTVSWLKVIKSRWREEDINEWKFKFTYGLAWLFFVWVMEVYKNIVFNSDLFGWEKLYEQMIKLWAYFLAPVAFFFVTLAWYYYLASWWDEAKMKKWKDIILYVLLWILIYLAGRSVLAELNF